MARSRARASRAFLTVVAFLFLFAGDAYSAKKTDRWAKVRDPRWYTRLTRITLATVSTAVALTVGNVAICAKVLSLEDELQFRDDVSFQVYISDATLRDVVETRVSRRNSLRQTMTEEQRKFLDHQLLWEFYDPDFDLEKMKTLIEQGANPDLISPIHEFTKIQDRLTVRHMVYWEEILDLLFSYGLTPIYHTNRPQEFFLPIWSLYQKRAELVLQKPVKRRWEHQADHDRFVYLKGDLIQFYLKYFRLAEKYGARRMDIEFALEEILYRSRQGVLWFRLKATEERIEKINEKIFEATHEYSKGGFFPRPNTLAHRLDGSIMYFYGVPKRTIQVLKNQDFSGLREMLFYAREGILYHEQLLDAYRDQK